jgi:hypothetical protein
MAIAIGREGRVMSSNEDFGGMGKREPSPSCERGNPGYTHSYWVGPGKGIRKRHIPYRVEVLYNRVLQLIAHACRADHAVLIMSAYSYPYDDIGRIYIYPEPVSDEEAKFWKYTAAYIGESVRLGVPLNVPGSLRDALNLGTVLVSPVFRYKDDASVVAVFSNSSSRKHPGRPFSKKRPASNEHMLTHSITIVMNVCQ